MIRVLFAGLVLATAYAACARGHSEPLGPVGAGGVRPAAVVAPVPPPPPVAAPELPLALQWSPDGARLAVGDRWLFEPARGQYTRLPCPFVGERARSACGAEAISFSPEGARVLFVDGDELAIDALPAANLPDGAPVMRVKIPRWVKTRAATEPVELVNVAFWTSARAVLVQQLDRRGALASACRLLAVPARPPARAPAVGAAWAPAPGGCLDADFHYLTRVDPGPRGLLALHSEGEGGFALGIVHHPAPRGSSAASATPSLVIDGASAVSVRFSRDGSSLDLVSPCDLSTGGERHAVSCADAFGGATWKLFTRRLPDGPLRLRRADLPRGAVMHPAGERFAWPAGASVCIGDPAGPPAPACFPLPTR